MIRVRTLGQCSIQLDSVHVGPDAEIVFASLLLLAIERGRRVERGELLGMLWPETPSARASHCLRQTLYRLRTLGVPLEVGRTHLTLTSGALDSDVDALLHASRADDLERLADRVSGPFLPGYSPSFSEPLRDWVERQRDLVTAAARRVLAGAISLRKSRGEWADVERLAHRCLAIDPLNEDATLAVAEAAALHGGKAEALGILDRYLREMGPGARELRLPAVVLRRRIAEPDLELPLAASHQVPFVGRSTELATLVTALRRAGGGTGSVHFVYGEPGIGKTRLLAEFTGLATIEGARIAATVCQSSDSRRPLSAFVDLVPKLMTMPGALGCTPQSHRYLRRLVEQRSTDESVTLETSEAALLYANVRRSLFDLLDAIASESPLILTVEDTQWLDTASWEIVADTAPWIETRRMMLVLTSRESEQGYPVTPISLSHPISSLRLGPIDRLAREALFDATPRQSRRAITSSFRNWCVEMSGGNPYYLTELASHGLDSHGAFEVPPSLTALVAQRVARLRSVSCRVLQACAVLGKNATLHRVHVLLDQPCSQLLNGLDELERAGLVEARDDKIVTRHDLLAQAATSRASALSQRLLHRQAAVLLQDEFMRTNVPSLAWDSAEHWRLSGESDKGVELAMACARYSLHFGRPTEAVEILRRVLPWCLDSATKLEVLGEFARSLRAAEQWSDLVDALEELLRNLDHSKMPGAASDYRLELLEAQWHAGRAPATIVDDLIEECSAGAADASHKLHAATATIVISENLCCAGTAPRVEQFARELANLNADDFVSRDYELVYHCSYGDLDTAMEVAEGLVRSVRESENEPLLCKYLLRASHAFEVGDRLERSLLAAEEAFHIAERFALCNSACLAARRLAWAYLDRLSVDDLARWTAKGEQWATRAQHPASLADLSMLRAEIELASGCVPAAEEWFKKSQVLWGPLKHSRAEAHALALTLAITVEKRGEVRGSDLDEAWRLFRLLGNRPLLDLVVGRFVLALAAAGRNAAATEMVDHYLHRSRRERGSVRPIFRHLMSRIHAEYGLT